MSQRACILATPLSPDLWSNRSTGTVNADAVTSRNASRMGAACGVAAGCRLAARGLRCRWAVLVGHDEHRRQPRHVDLAGERHVVVAVASRGGGPGGLGGD